MTVENINIESFKEDIEHYIKKITEQQETIKKIYWDTVARTTVDTLYKLHLLTASEVDQYTDRINAAFLK